MSNNEILRELVFGVLFSLIAVICFVSGESYATEGAIFFGLVAAYSWFQLVSNARTFKKQPKIKPVNPDTVHGQRQAAYLADPRPLRILQWDKNALWITPQLRCDVHNSVYFCKSDDGHIRFDTAKRKDSCAKLFCKDGIWFFSPTAPASRAYVNTQGIRDKCPGQKLNYQEFSIPQGAALELIPGDGLVFFLEGDLHYFRIVDR